MKEKSYNDVMQQLDRIHENHSTSEHYERATKIAHHYLSQLSHFCDDDNDEKLGYEYRSFMPDTSLAVIATLKPRKLDGLWFEYNGEKLTPSNLYFGCDTRLIRSDVDGKCGKCFTLYDNALRPVYLSNGERFVWYPLANVNCRYKNGRLYGFYRQ